MGGSDGQLSGVVEKVALADGVIAEQAPHRWDNAALGGQGAARRAKHNCVILWCVKDRTRQPNYVVGGSSHDLQVVSNHGWWPK